MQKQQTNKQDRKEKRKSAIWVENTADTAEYYYFLLIIILNRITHTLNKLYDKTKKTKCKMRRERQKQ